MLALCLHLSRIGCRDNKNISAMGPGSRANALGRDDRGAMGPARARTRLAGMTEARALRLLGAAKERDAPQPRLAPTS